MDKDLLNPTTIVKFLLISFVGIFVFLTPVSYGGNSTTVVSILITQVGNFLSPYIKYIAPVVIAFSACGSLYDYVQTKRGKEVNPWIHERLSTGPVYIVSKFLTLIFVVMYYYGLGSETYNETVGDMVGLCVTLVSLSLSISFLLVFLTDGGLMEFVGVLMKPIVRPLFTVPSDATMDLLASWIGASDAAVVLSQGKFRSGYYSRREAAVIMTNFSLVSVSFCLVVAQIARVEQYFSVMYLLICALGILLATIMPRLYPLKGLPDEYVAQKIEPPVMNEDNTGILKRALAYGCAVAKDFGVRRVLTNGFKTFSSVLLGVMPVAIGWGVIGMFVINMTPIFDWMSIPMRWILELLGVEDAAAVAPATLVGFIDMYIPSLLIVGVESVRTRFVIATLSLIQIVYITIVGAVVMQSKVGLNPLKLFVIFIERTIIALPIIVLASRVLIP